MQAKDSTMLANSNVSRYTQSHICGQQLNQ